MDENENITHDYKNKLLFTEADFEILKNAVKQVKGFEIFEISRFHEVLDPLKETSGKTVNEWISLIFNAINIQNLDEFNRLIKLAENGQTKNPDR